MTDSKPPVRPARGLSVRDIACVRGARLLFAGLGFSLEPGGLMLLTGPNGIGKSSLLRILAGLLPPARGRVDLADAAAPIAYLGHGDGLKPLATVAETLAFWTALNGGPDAGARAKAMAKAMAHYALGPLADLPCRYLSAGQRRRVGLARVLAAGAGLWLLDEPTTALDEAGASAFESALAAHRAGGGMAVIATHAPIGGGDAATLALEPFARLGADFPDPFADPGDLPGADAAAGGAP